MRIHIVRGHETLWELAKQYNVPVARILKANPQLTENQPLPSGSKVRIPSGKVPVSQAQGEEKRAEAEEKEPVSEQPVSERKKEEPLLTSPNIAVDPDAFFLEQEEFDQDELYQEGYPPSMPYHLPPYPSFYPHSFGPYSWMNAPGPMYPYGMPFAPMPPCGCRPPAYSDESSSYI